MARLIGDIQKVSGGNYVLQIRKDGQADLVHAETGMTIANAVNQFITSANGEAGEVKSLRLVVEKE